MRPPRSCSISPRKRKACPAPATRWRSSARHSAGPTASAWRDWPSRSWRCSQQWLRSTRCRRITRNCSRLHGLPAITPACTAPSISPTTISGACWNGRCLDCPFLLVMAGLVPAIHVLTSHQRKTNDDNNTRPKSVESHLMDSLNPAAPPITVIPTQRSPRIWKFWATALWGLFIFAAMFAGQIAVVAWFVLWLEGPIDIAAAIHVVGGGLTISLSVIMGMPAVLAALWIPIRFSRTPFADYLALRLPSWTNLLIGVLALFVLVMGWDVLSRAAGREVAPGFMGEVLKSARADGAVWLLGIAFH